jgi:hypothetical protein
MLFGLVDFAQLNETGIREEILAPLLRELGYGSGTKHRIIYEQSLRYPRFFLGRKDPKKDPELRGKADYICEVDRKIRWTIEAKSPASEITTDDIEQSYSYANHPEIRAVHFCICNGHEFRVYQTNHGPQSPPILSIQYQEFNEKFDTLKNLLSPAAISRNWPTLKVDVGKPLGPGLRSIAQITGGFIQFTSNSLNLPYLNGVTNTITDGAIERNETGQLTAFIQLRSPLAQIQRLNERLGLTRYELISNDSIISIDPNTPTAFSLLIKTYLSSGERIFNLSTWNEITLPFNIVFNIETSARGRLVGQDFKGIFRQKIKSDFLNLSPSIGTPPVKQALERIKLLETIGEFEAHLA